MNDLTPQLREALYGKWENPKGFSNYKHHEKKALFSWRGFNFHLFPGVVREYIADPDAPLTYVAADGTAYRPDKHFFNDGASVPPLLHCLIEPEGMEFSAILHDSAYEHKGLWVRALGEEVFTFRKMSRSEVDSLLRQMVVAEGRTESEGRAIHAAVFVAGWVPWYSKSPEKQATVMRAL